jgi:NADH:ubiquinone oxidoreductase subunit 3 (subunit A)
MPRIRRRRRKYEQGGDRQQIAETTTMRLGALILFFLLMILILIFRIGEAWWFKWMIEFRTPMIGILSFFGILLALSSPVIIEADTHPRRLSGPGKNPNDPWGP